MFAVPEIFMAAAAAMARRREVIERACEASLVGGQFGVLVDESEGWARVDPSAPYGERWHRGSPLDACTWDRP